MKNYNLDRDEIKKSARGRWFEIILALSSHSSDLLEKATKKIGAYYVQTACPICGGVDRFGFLPDAKETGGAYCRHCSQVSVNGYPDGFALLSALNSWNFYQSLHAVAEYIGHNQEPIKRQNIEQSSDSCVSLNTEQLAKRKNAIQKILERCHQEPMQPHINYLKNRGLGDVIGIKSPSLLYHAGLPYYISGKPLKDSKGKWLTWPAIVGRISSSQGWIGIQKIYLTKDGNKAVESIKQGAIACGLPTESIDCKVMLKACNSLNGGAVRLQKATNKLAVCEGIETGLAVHLMTGLPIACTGTTSLMKVVEIPKQVEHLLIYADNDVNNAGLNAAKVLFEREHQLRKVDILLPPLEANSNNVDWLDMLRKTNLKRQ